VKADPREEHAIVLDPAVLKGLASTAIARCRTLAAMTDVPGETTRTFLSPAMRHCMEAVQQWMVQAQMSVRIDTAGNLRATYPGTHQTSKRLIIGSHLDTVPNAGAFDGVLGVMIGLALIESLDGRRLPFTIELIGFSEEEGVRFRTLIGSRALVGDIDDLLQKQDADGISVEEALREFGLDPADLPGARLGADTLGYLEFHIEQGPVLEQSDLSLGVVTAITGQTRGEMRFTGAANHAGTTPMHLRRDALAAAARWISEVEEVSLSSTRVTATVGRVEVFPNAGNVVPGEVRASLDVRSADDALRSSTVKNLVARATSIAAQRGLKAEWHLHMDQEAVFMDRDLTDMAEAAVRDLRISPLRMVSGAGHDAMVIAKRLASAMIFLRSPGGLSHHPDESVRTEDVENAIAAGVCFLERLAAKENGAHA
jgi:allantoate deiminase